MYTSYVLLLLVSVAVLTAMELRIPREELGFVYKDGSPGATVKIAAYVDPTCPYSKKAFPVLTQVADTFNASEVQLRLYLFPLPYHRNSHLLSKTTHFLRGYFKTAPSNATMYDWLRVVYDNIDLLTTTATRNQTEIDVFNFITSLALKLFPISAHLLHQGVYNSTIDSLTRLEFDYACTRGVFGTPTFSVNDVFIDADSTWSVSRWLNLIRDLLPSTPTPAGGNNVVIG